MEVCGKDGFYQLGEPVQKQNCIVTLVKSHISSYPLLSFSIYSDYSIWVTKNGQAYAIGSNENGFIWPSLFKGRLGKETQIIISDKNDQPYKFLSVACGYEYTLYLVCKNTPGSIPELVYVHKGCDPFFLNINGRTPKALYAGDTISAAIDSDGGILIIPESIVKTTDMKISPLFLPDDHQAIQLACCNEFMIALSSTGKVFKADLSQNKATHFFKVAELFELNVIHISGLWRHCFAVTDSGSVFGFGDNNYSKLGFDAKITNFSSFIKVNSLSEYTIISAFAGSHSSLFLTDDGKVFGCGINGFGQMTVTEKIKLYKTIFPPINIEAKGKVTSCICGDSVTVLFVDKDPPPNSPNMKIMSGIRSPNARASELEDENKELREKSILANNRVSKLEDENKELREKLDLANNRVSKLEDENKELREKLDLANNRVSELERQISTTSHKDAINTPKQSRSLTILSIEELEELHKIKSIGRGATSEVYKVTKDEHFALKIFYTDSTTDEEQEEGNAQGFNFENLKRFVREYEVLNQLDHPNIIKTYGICFGDENHSPSILLEYCPSNLKSRIKKLTDLQRIQIIIEISSAMKQVHSVGLIHRDLKMENILLDFDNHAKVSDFGLCTLIENDSESTSHHTQMQGTLKFMAPELIQERTDYNEKVDVYAFGVVVYLILTKGSYPKISLMEIGSGKKATIPNEITNFSKDLINKCWSFKADDRPSFNEIYQLINENKDKLI